MRWGGRVPATPLRRRSAASATESSITLATRTPPSAGSIITPSRGLAGAAPPSVTGAIRKTALATAAVKASQGAPLSTASSTAASDSPKSAS